MEDRMRWVLAALMAMVTVCAATDAFAKRKHVRIYKPSPPVASQGYQYPLAVVPPALIAFDLVRRTTCDPALAVSTGKGDPGFDLVDGPKTGNFLIPAIYSRCAGRPQPK